MTTDDFRRIALSLPGAEELNGLGYPNFCTGRKSFATIEDSKAVIRLTRDQQAAFVAAAPAVFEPVSSGWGRLGRTVIKLEVADEGTVQDALATAWRNVTDAADVSESREAAPVLKVVDAASIVNVEPHDHLASVIERLQVCWEMPARAPPVHGHGRDQRVI
jgi:hypothetical protein